MGWGTSIVAMGMCGSVQTLKAAGFTGSQARAVARPVHATRDPFVTALATTADLRLGLAETKAGFWRYRVVVALAIQAVAIIGTVVALVHSVAHG
jgi:hypothetical protein